MGPVRDSLGYSSPMPPRIKAQSVPGSQQSFFRVCKSRQCYPKANCAHVPRPAKLGRILRNPTPPNQASETPVRLDASKPGRASSRRHNSNQTHFSQIQPGHGRVQQSSARPMPKRKPKPARARPSEPEPRQGQARLMRSLAKAKPGHVQSRPPFPNPARP